MNPHVKLATVTQSEISSAEWQARVDLAATYRLIAHYGWGDVIYNHSSLRVPGEARNFLIKRHELLYTEVTPSNLVKVSMDDDLDESAGVNRPGFTLHGGVLSARPGRQLRRPRAYRDRHGTRRITAWTAHGIAASGAFL
jgi:class II aldolase/adducin N-terminal domain-containing protein